MPVSIDQQEAQQKQESIAVGLAEDSGRAIARRIKPLSADSTQCVGCPMCSWSISWGISKASELDRGPFPCQILAGRPRQRLRATGHGPPICRPA